MGLNLSLDAVVETCLAECALRNWVSCLNQADAEIRLITVTVQVVMHTGYPRGVFSCPAPAPAENPSRVYGWRDTRGYLYGSHAQYDILINTFKKIKNIFKKIKDFAGLGIPAHPCYTLWFVEASHLNA